MIKFKGIDLDKPWGLSISDLLVLLIIWSSFYILFLVPLHHRSIVLGPNKFAIFLLRHPNTQHFCHGINRQTNKLPIWQTNRQTVGRTDGRTHWLLSVVILSYLVFVELIGFWYLFCILNLVIISQISTNRSQYRNIRRCDIIKNPN